MSRAGKFNVPACLRPAVAERRSAMAEAGEADRRREEEARARAWAAFRKAADASLTAELGFALAGPVVAARLPETPPADFEPREPMYLLRVVGGPDGPHVACRFRLPRCGVWRRDEVSGLGFRRLDPAGLGGPYLWLARVGKTGRCCPDLATAVAWVEDYLERLAAGEEPEDEPPF